MHTQTDRVVASNVARLADEQGIPLKVLGGMTGISDRRLRGFITGSATLIDPEVERLAIELGTTKSALATEAAR